VLYLDREDEPERHRGAVVRLQGGVFAPSAAALRFLRPGTFHVGTRRLAYTDELRALWRRDPGAFLALIELATGGNDLTLVDHRSGTVERRHTVCAGPELVAGLALADGPTDPVAYLGILSPGPPAAGGGAAGPDVASRIVAVRATTGAVVATLPLAGDPWHLVLAAAPGRGGRRVYAVEAQPRAWEAGLGAVTGRLLALDPATLAVEREWPLFPVPAALAVAPDGEHAYALTESLLTHLDLGTGTQRRLALLPRGAGGLAVTDARVYATDLAGREVWAVDRHGGHLVQSIPVGRHPAHLALGSAG
jgi:hypothetical protein